MKASLDGAKAVDKAAKPQAVAAASKVSTLVKKKTRGKTNAEKLELLHALHAPATKIIDDFKKAQFEIYKTLELDPKFVAEDKRKREQTVKALVGTDKDKAEMKKMRDGWGDLEPDEKRALIKKTVEAHCQSAGHTGPQKYRVQRSRRNPHKLYHLKDRGWQVPITRPTRIFNQRLSGQHVGDFAATLDTIFHENSHHYQHELADKLANGNLPKEDPEYEEALLFQANFEPQGYVKYKHLCESRMTPIRINPQKSTHFPMAPTLPKTCWMR